jgi:FkbM family methyltransferase
MALIKPPLPSGNLVIKKLRGFSLKLKFNPSNYQGKFLYYRGMYEDAIIKTVCDLLEPGMKFIDIGANIGLYSIITARIVGKAGRVVAFEPQPALIRILRDNIELNGLTNIDVVNCALGSKQGRSELFQVAEENEGEATLRLRGDEKSVGTPTTVEVRRLTDVLEELDIGSVDMVKIDTEGAELEVLKGFNGWLAERPPKYIFVECIDDHLKRFGADSSCLISFLIENGYKCFYLKSGHWRSVSIKRFFMSPFHSEEIMAVK